MLISADSADLPPAPALELPPPPFAPVSSGFERPGQELGAAVAAPQTAAPVPADTGFGAPATLMPATPVGSFDPMAGGQPSPQDGWIVPAGAGLSATASPSVRDEVLAELGRLSGYSPSTPASGGELTPRTPAPTPELQPVGAGPSDRDPEAVRGRFSSFRSGVGRGRRSRD